jgi:hypothetical protein
MPGVLAVGVLVSGVVTVRVIVVGVIVPGPPASWTKAAVRTPRPSTIASPTPISGVRQLGVEASRVRAAAPQRRHHSCLAPSGDPHNGQASLVVGGGADPAGAAVVLTCAATAPDE